MTQSTASSVTKREFLIFLYKYRLKLILAFLVPFICAVIFSFFPIPRYKAESVLIVRLGSEYVYQPEVSASGNANNAAIPFDHDEIFKSEVAILNSDDLHAHVIDAVGLEKLYPEILHPTGIALFWATMKDIGNSTLAQLGIHKTEPSEDEIKQRHLARAVQLFDKRLDIVLEKESAVIDVYYENKDRELAASTLDTLIKLYFEKRKQLYTDQRSGLVETEVEEKRQQALDAEHAVEKYKRKHKIYSLDDERDELLDRRSAAEEQLATVSTAALQKKIANYNLQLDKLDAVEREYNRLQKEAQIAESSYTLYSGKLDEAKAYDELQSRRADSVRIIQPAIVPADPIKLQSLIILVGFFASILCMLLIAAITEFSNKGFMTPEQIERSLGLPVMGVFPLRQHS